jgi:hypothetical protein
VKPPHNRLFAVYRVITSFGNVSNKARGRGSFGECLLRSR